MESYRNCNNCKHQKLYTDSKGNAVGKYCNSWNCEYLPKEDKK